MPSSVTAGQRLGVWQRIQWSIHTVVVTTSTLVSLPLVVRRGHQVERLVSLEPGGLDVFVESRRLVRIRIKQRNYNSSFSLTIIITKK